MSAKKQFAEGYIDVATRIAEIRGEADRTYPEGSFQPFDPANPYRIEVIDGQTYIVYVAAFYRTPDDPRPGVGSAWESVPGKTPYTKGSELQNAETSAWGRALVATLAADTKRGIASADEVRNRSAEHDVEPVDGPISAENAARIVQACEHNGVDVAEVVKRGTDGRTDDPAEVLRSEIPAVRSALAELVGEPS